MSTGIAQAVAERLHTLLAEQQRRIDPLIDGLLELDEASEVLVVPGGHGVLL